MHTFLSIAAFVAAIAALTWLLMPDAPPPAVTPRPKPPPAAEAPPCVCGRCGAIQGRVTLRVEVDKEEDAEIDWRGYTGQETVSGGVGRKVEPIQMRALSEEERARGKELLRKIADANRVNTRVADVHGAEHV